MKPVFLFLALLGIGAFFWLKPQTVNYQKLGLVPSRANTGQADTCLGKPKCLVIYVAPWCQYCNGCTDGIRALSAELNSTSDKGVIVFVGAAEKEKLEQMAAAIGPNTYLDEDSLWARELNIKGLPSWMVLNSKGKVSRKLSGAFHECSADVIKNQTLGN